MVFFFFLFNLLIVFFEYPSKAEEDYLYFQVGYLLGLGDRHPSNLMLHRSRYVDGSKRCKHITTLQHVLFLFVLQWEDLAY